MKLLVLFAVGAVVLGSIYHAEVVQYLAGLSDGEGPIGGVMPVADSIQGMGSAAGNLMGQAGGALNR